MSYVELQRPRDIRVHITNPHHSCFGQLGRLTSKVLGTGDTIVELDRGGTTAVSSDDFRTIS